MESQDILKPDMVLWTFSIELQSQKQHAEQMRVTH